MPQSNNNSACFVAKLSFDNIIFTILRTDSGSSPLFELAILYSYWFLERFIFFNLINGSITVIANGKKNGFYPYFFYSMYKLRPTISRA